MEASFCHLIASRKEIMPTLQCSAVSKRFGWKSKAAELLSSHQGGQIPAMLSTASQLAVDSVRWCYSAADAGYALRSFIYCLAKAGKPPIFPKLETIIRL